MQTKYITFLSSPPKENTINLRNSKGDSIQLWQQNCLSKTVQYYVTHQQSTFSVLNRYNYDNRDHAVTYMYSFEQK